MAKTFYFITMEPYLTSPRYWYRAGSLRWNRERADIFDTKKKALQTMKMCAKDDPKNAHRLHLNKEESNGQ